MSDEGSSSDSDSGVRYKTQSVRTDYIIKPGADIFGPCLPNKNNSYSDESYGPTLPSNKNFGPSLPPSKSIQSYGLAIPGKSCTSASIEEKSYGPLPPKPSGKPELYGPSLSTKSSKRAVDDKDDTFGPILPKKMCGTILPTEKESSDSEEESYGPTLPPKTDTSSSESKNRVFGPTIPDSVRFQAPEESDSDDDEQFGPLPSDHMVNSRAKQIQDELEYRALQIKMNSANPQNEVDKEREEWMLELPDVKQIAQTLGPRQFRAKQGPDMSDRSQWTDTPETKKHKKSKSKDAKTDLKSETEYLEKRKYDLEQEKMIKKFNKKHKKDKKSLVEIHRDKMAKGVS